MGEKICYKATFSKQIETRTASGDPMGTTKKRKTSDSVDRLTMFISIEINRTGGRPHLFEYEYDQNRKSFR